MQLSADQLQVLTAALRVADHEDVPSERRRTQRREVRATVSVTLVSDGEPGKTLLLRLRDLSPRGVALLHGEPFESGQQFVLALPRQDGPAATILCTTMHSRPGVGKLHIIGAEFTCALSDLPPSAPPSDTAQARIRDSILD